MGSGDAGLRDSLMCFIDASEEKDRLSRPTPEKAGSSSASIPAAPARVISEEDFEPVNLQRKRTSTDG